MMKSISEIKSPKFYLLLLSSFILLMVWKDTASFNVSFFTPLWNNVWRAPYILVVNYIFFEHIVNLILKKRRFIIYTVLLGIFWIWVFMMLWSFGLYTWRSIGVLLDIYTPLGLPDKSSIIEGQAGFSAASVFFFGIIRHVYKHIKLTQAEQQLRIEKQAAELNYLRSQTNPHFLFNTLNNIYALTKTKSDSAPEAVMRLSKLLRFMLYETSVDYIAIEQEIKIINDYIELEKLRYDESLRINSNYDIEDMKQSIPPLILIPLVENAFKHGASESRSSPFVEIHLTVKQRQLLLIVRNSSDALPEHGIKENIGLSNLRRQLELLYKDYNLTVRNENYVFSASLKINLASHV